MGLSSILRVGGLLVIGVCMLFMVMAFTIDGSEHTGIEGAQPAMPVPRRQRRPYNTPAPVVKPGNKPSYMDWLGDEHNLRQCQCRKDWKSQQEGTQLCRCGGRVCPSHVTPPFLTEAKGQALCSLEEHTGFNCYADCVEAADPKDAVKWFATPCGGSGQPACEPAILSYRKAARAESARRAEDEKKKAEEEKKVANYPKVTWDADEVYDLRGLKCEELGGKEQCFMEDEQGRELCPPHVDKEYLSRPPDQFLCSKAMVDKFYCTVSCTSDSNEARWGAHEISWCYDPKNLGACPPRPTPIPKAEWKAQPWSQKPEVELPCAKRWKDGERPPKVPNLTIGLLTHEAKAFAVSMKTYEELGFFDVVSEFLIFMNRRRPEVEAVAQQYAQKYPQLIRLMGDENNWGILQPMIWLTGNSSNEYFMFLERDFQLIEPATCVYEQFTTGIDMVKSGKAHVVRYRHRRHPGRPNWAARMFMGHEDDVFKNGQPNLFCNHYYWIEEPDKRWPDKMWICNKDPVMYCSDSFYCNWTNNPQLWYIPWWNKEYVEQFAHFTRNDPWYDIEVYMNWEPNSWNDRKWTVAQGDGLFKHSDRAKWG